MTQQWLDWAIELQSLAQAGLTYGKDQFDLERYTRIREISAEILANYTELPIEKVKSLFCNETGYQTPKIDTRAAIFQNHKILLVKENDGKWSLPGGWVDVHLSVKENIIKEVKEESGYIVNAEKLIAVQDRNKHNSPRYAYGVCKIFVLCSIIGGHFEENIETVACDFFDLTALPELSEAKNTKAQIEMCFQAYIDKHWQVMFD